MESEARGCLSTRPDPRKASSTGCDARVTRSGSGAHPREHVPSTRTASAGGRPGRCLPHGTGCGSRSRRPCPGPTPARGAPPAPDARAVCRGRHGGTPRRGLASAAGRRGDAALPGRPPGRRLGGARARVAGVVGRPRPPRGRATHRTQRRGQGSARASRPRRRAHPDRLGACGARPLGRGPVGRGPRNPPGRRQCRCRAAGWVDVARRAEHGGRAGQPMATRGAGAHAPDPRRRPQRVRRRVDPQGRAEPAGDPAGPSVRGP